MISVVVPVHNGMPWLEDQISALVEQKCPTDWELILVDDASSDGSLAELRRWTVSHPAVRLVELSHRSGPSWARNQGASAARGDLLAFCDADDLVNEGWLAGMVAALGKADVVAGIFDFWSLEGRRSPSPIPAATQQFGFLPAGLAANLGVSRAAFIDVDGFAVELDTGEDIDLCWRLQLRGYRFQITEDCVIAKRDRSDLRQVFGQSRTYGRCGPKLFKRHRRAGAHRYLLGATKSWAHLLVSAPKLTTVDGRRDWVRSAGVRIGRLEGSLQERVFFP